MTTEFHDFDDNTDGQEVEDDDLEVQTPPEDGN